jgi:Xaa-Pro aminopeptidase
MQQTEPHRAEVDRKTARLAALAREAGVGGIVLSTQHNFTWLTGGRINRVDASRELGASHLLVTAQGRRFVLASAIETPRMTQEALAGLEFESIEFSWTDERANPSLPFALARRAAGVEALGADTATGGAQPLEPRIARVRSTFDEAELPRYRHLGAVCGRAIGEIARGVSPGTSEREVARAVAATLLPLDIRPVVLLIAGDERIARYRHPVPTDLRWTRRLLIACCAEHGGLIVALSRLVCTRRDDELFARTRATADVFAALLEATAAGATGSTLFGAAAAAYERAGFPGEERLHHQGGAIAYRAREWVAHPASEEVVTPPQAFAWNPTITGTKVEETCVLHADGRLELVTASPDWPSIAVTVRQQRLDVPDVLALGR